MKLLFLGDVMLGRLVNEVLRHESYQYPWGNTLKILAKADWRICNLECVIADNGEEWDESPKTFHFRTDMKNIAVLENANIDAVSLANNHTIDYGYGKMLEMLVALDDIGIAHSGVGVDVVQSAEPSIQNVKGLKVGVLAFTDNEPYWAATDKKPGTFYVPLDLDDERVESLFKAIEWTKKYVDILIVSAHWGGNWGYEVPAEHIGFAHAMIDRGADIIYGHSPHVYRGIEIYKGKPILYSTGDFVNDYAVDEKEPNDQSFIFTIHIEGKNLCELILYPTVIRSLQAMLAEDEEAREISQRMQKLCGELGTLAEWVDEERCLKIKV